MSSPGSTNGSLPRRALSRLGFDVRQGELVLSLLLFIYCFLLGTFQFTAKTVRQASFVDSLGAERLPYVYLLVAIVAYPLLRIYNRIAAKTRFSTVLLGFTLASAGCLFVFWWLYQQPWPWARFLFYIWISIVTLLSVSQFWSYAGHVFDSRQARRLFALVGAGGLLGGVAGGQVARLANEALGTGGPLLAGAFVLILTAATIPVIESRRRRQPAREEESFASSTAELASGTWDLIRKSKHLRTLAAIMLLMVAVAQIIDLQFNWVVERETQTLGERTAVFGNLFSLMGLAAFIFQMLVTGRLQRHLGVVFSMRVLPVSTGIGTVLLLLTGGFFPTAMLLALASIKVVENALRYSLEQSTRELLFVPIPVHLRSQAKVYIDVLVQRVGRGAVALLLLTVTFGWIDVLHASWLTLLFIVIWLGLTVLARKYYVGSFRQGLMRRQLDPEEQLDLTDINTMEVLVQSLGSSDERLVLHSLQLLSTQGKGHLVSPLLLHHTDPQVRRATLQVLAEQKRTDALELVDRLLADPDADVRAQAVETLAQLAGDEEAKLMEPRLRDPDRRVRAAAVTRLVHAEDVDLQRRALGVLDELLQDESPASRVEAARALAGQPQAIATHRLVRLLYDQNTEVVRQAIASIRTDAEERGANPIYFPLLIARLRDRRLKNDAREALVACGDIVVPALRHFMNDSNEHNWVRRSIPKTLALFQPELARDTLLESLPLAKDTYLRRQIIEALALLRVRKPDLEFDEPQVERQVRAEAQRYLDVLSKLYQLAEPGSFIVQGARLSWRGDRAPHLLLELLKDRLDEALGNVFGLLSLVYRPNDMRAALDRLLSASTSTRAHATEYLDNVLRPGVRRSVLAVIDDLPLIERLQQAEFRERSPEARLDLLRELLSAGQIDSERNPWLAALALDFIRVNDIAELTSEIESLATRDDVDPLLAETARWALSRPAA